MFTSICIFKCVLNRDSNDKNMANDSSNTSGTDDVPLLDKATHKNCLMAVINIGLVRNTGPAFCKIDNKRCKDRIFERNSCDLQINHIITRTHKLSSNNTYLGSGVPSGKGFIDNLHNERKTRKASFCNI